MKLIIAGTRTGTREALDAAVRAYDPEVGNPQEIVSGCAAGIDSLGREWAAEWWIPVVFFYPEWELYGKAAGPIRNQQMAEYADALLAVWDGKSRGTKDMIDKMTKMGKPVYVHRYGTP